MISATNQTPVERYDLNRVADKFNRVTELRTNEDWKAVFDSLTDTTNYDLVASLTPNDRDFYKEMFELNLDDNREDGDHATRFQEAYDTAFPMYKDSISNSGRQINSEEQTK